jgi:hypothetical protein
MATGSKIRLTVNPSVRPADAGVDLDADHLEEFARRFSRYLDPGFGRALIEHMHRAKRAAIAGDQQVHRESA